MKSDAMTKGMAVTKKNSEHVRTETNEISSKDDFSGKNERVFGVVDLWNIQRQYRSMNIRRWMN